MTPPEWSAATTGAGRPADAVADRPVAGAGPVTADIPAEPTGGAAVRCRTDAVLRARVWLSRVVEPGSAAVYRYVQQLGPVEAVRRIRTGAVPAAISLATGARRHLDQVDADLDLAERHSLRVLLPEDEGWPHFALLPMEAATARGVPDLAPPLMVWLRGSPPLDEITGQAVAIVGARASTPYGEHVASDLAYRLAGRSWAVVSGGAFGIDAAAHRGALAAGGRTVAVIAGGLDSPYPRGNTRLFERIAAEGLLVSEWPPGCPPQRHRFLLRNRLIAGLVSGTVVVEAGRRSGARNTARRTSELGRCVMCVPGPVTSAMSVGSHQLLREADARVVTSAEEVLEEIGRIGEDLAPPPVPAARTVTDDLEPAARRVLDGISARRPGSPEQISCSSGVPVGLVLRWLPTLELLGLVTNEAGAWRLTRSARRRAGGR
jgi:DNA processing protein